MTKELIEHVNQNKETFRIWIETNQKLQIDSDYLKPLVPEFLKEFPEVSIEGCPECIIDMLRWAIKEAKVVVIEPKKIKANG